MATLVVLTTHQRACKNTTYRTDKRRCLLFTMSTLVYGAEPSALSSHCQWQFVTITCARLVSTSYRSGLTSVFRRQDCGLSTFSRGIICHVSPENSLTSTCFITIPRSISDRSWQFFWYGIFPFATRNLLRSNGRARNIYIQSWEQ